jgi:UDP-glucose 4-epimerase
MHLVTGGAGFIGSHIVEALLKQGEAVRVVDNFSTGRLENLRGMTHRIDLLTGDISDPEIAQAAMESVDIVFHQAALPSVPRSIRDPLGTHEASSTGTLQLLHAAQRAGVSRFVYAASSSAYGNTPTLPKIETMPTSPRSPYAVAKLSGEHYCQAFFHVHGLETVCLRYFNIFGPRQDPDSPYAAVIPKFAGELLAGRSPVIYGSGEQTRDFTYIDNAVQANLLAAQVAGIGGEVFNVACGQRISLNQLVALIQEETGVHLAPQHTLERAGDVRDSLADIEKAKRMLGYQPSIGIEEGIALTVADLAGHKGFRRAA